VLAEGVLLVDKPEGMTSHDVVAIARRATGTRRIGHAGTLDPFATGLLVLLVGRATRLLPYLDGEPKVYDATIGFGAETTTDDGTGAVSRTAPLPAPEAVRAAIPTLTGWIDQIPPAYSAKQQNGVRAYAAARQGDALALAPSRVHVHQWELRSPVGDTIDVRISCGGGTYIRALARDLGRACGSAAHLVRLRRLSSGDFHVGHAVSLAGLRGGPVELRSARSAVGRLSERSLNDEELARVSHGRSVDADQRGTTGERIAAIDAAGALVAILERDGDRLAPRLVLRDG
jgi:tRNA pseudouridine55 synthase